MCMKTEDSTVVSKISEESEYMVDMSGNTPNDCQEADVMNYENYFVHTEPIHYVSFLHQDIDNAAAPILNTAIRIQGTQL